MANNNYGKWSDIITDISHAATVTDRASSPLVERACRLGSLRGTAHSGPVGGGIPRSSARRTRHGCRRKARVDTDNYTPARPACGLHRKLLARCGLGFGTI